MARSAGHRSDDGAILISWRVLIMEYRLFAFGCAGTRLAAD